MVVPSSSGIWNYTTKGIGCGTVVAVIYNGQIEYAVVGDTGPSEIIGTIAGDDAILVITRSERGRRAVQVRLQELAGLPA